MGIIPLGSQIPMNAKGGTMPDLSGALRDWFRPMNFNTVTKVMVYGVSKETMNVVSFMGVIFPMEYRELILKPEGQRSWTWYQLFADPVLTLNTDDVVNYNKQTRVKGRKDWQAHGFIEYHLVEDWTGVGPAVS